MVPSFNEQEQIIKYLQTGPTSTTRRGNYQRIQISTLSTQQMLIHALKDSPLEVMGLLVGNTQDDEILITKTFGLPVRSSETRVNAQADSYEYMVRYVNEMLENEYEVVVGWYHSHPGYDCWLSTVDQRTQDLNQRFQDPYVAVVVDPVKSQDDGVIALGAFRTMEAGGQLHSVELDIVQFDSDLNKGLSRPPLKYRCPSKENYNEEVTSNLLNKLYESMQQISSLQVENGTNSLSLLYRNPSGNRSVHTESQDVDQGLFSMSETKSSSDMSLTSTASTTGLATTELGSRPAADLGSSQSSVQLSAGRPSLYLRRESQRERPSSGNAEDTAVDYASYQAVKQKLLAHRTRRLDRLKAYRDCFRLP